ncbi:MAG: hypothetical protein ACREEP_10260 [Dongiaceae bacterium]
MRLMAEGRLGREIALTCRGRIDGAGTQAIAIISATELARIAGCRYWHSPFSTISHAIDDPESWAKRWERFLNLGHGETPAPPDAEPVSLAAVVRDPDAFAGLPILIGEPRFHSPPGLGSPVLEGLRAELRAKYRIESKAELPLHRGPDGSLTAAIHVRRGDVSATKHAERYVADELLLRSIARLRAVVAPTGRPLHVNFYSEGVPDDFRAFAEAGCRLHISADALETFRNLVVADILVRAPGNFSRLAGLLSEGIVIGLTKNSPRLSNWVSRRVNGDLYVRPLRQALLARANWLERRKYYVRRWWRRRIPRIDL